MGKYFTLWSSWFAGHDMEDMKLLGMSLMWWGRLGKVAQFAGGLAVIIDILGPERVTRAGHRLSTYNAAKKFRLWARQLVGCESSNQAEATAVAHETTARNEESSGGSARRRAWPEAVRENSQADRIGTALYTLMQLLLFFAIAITPFYIADARDGDAPFQSSGYLTGLALCIILASGATAAFFSSAIRLFFLVVLFLLPLWVALSFLQLFTLALDFLAFRPTAAVLVRTSMMKWVGVLLFVMGFHFDLLAS
ncbi:hypothetical protein [Actinoplanes auranticolor]|uniref:Uncharacterized protein n=1 Tax=Actinoplanes auranticolor TaxID=47988 RepID=A0A919VTM7_9ACTN|nr:hypothetical protein [Actinoplanes auranticolor]GIM74935.1 hypothetical protein Aau02nite_63390 [Actinoplanes auranticolor]